MSVRRRIWTGPSGEEQSRWVADYTDISGRRRRKMFERKKDAEAFLLKARSEVREGLHIADSETVTVGKAGEFWLVSGEAAGLERTTLDQRRSHLEHHIKPLIGELRLNKLTVPGITTFQDRLRSSGCSPAMVKRVTVSLGSIIADAQVRGLAIRNPVHERSRARSVDRTAEKRSRKRLEVGADFPTTAEIKRLIDAAEGRWRAFLVTAAFTGLRASELRGLRWVDVDLKKKTVEVRQRADRYRAMGSPKSEAGHRRIPVPPLVVNTLKEWALQCPRGELGLVFPNLSGNVEFHQNIVQRGYWPCQIAAGITRQGPKDKAPKPKYPGLHALRHWFASWCINAKEDGGLGLSAKAVQSRLGHSSIQMTFDVYGHLFPSTDEAATLAAAEAKIFAA